MNREVMREDILDILSGGEVTEVPTAKVRRAQLRLARAEDARKEAEQAYKRARRSYLISMVRVRKACNALIELECIDRIGVRS